MIDKIIKRLFSWEVISYLVFGVLTTIVNIGVYWICSKSGADYRVANVIAWIAAVLFAFCTNKLFVFKSKTENIKELLREFFLFVGCRLVSFGFDMGFMIFAVEIIRMDDFLAKLISNVFVMAANYIFSKLFIFRKK